MKRTGIQMSCALTLLGLEAAASEFDCSYLGLLIAKHRPPLGFGGLAQWLKASPDLGTALTKGHGHFYGSHLRWDLDS